MEDQPLHLGILELLTLAWEGFFFFFFSELSGCRGAHVLWEREVCEAESGERGQEEGCVFTASPASLHSFFSPSPQWRLCGLSLV